MLSNVRDSRGEYAKKIGSKNRETIVEFIAENPMCSIREIMEGVKMTRITVHKHLKALKKIEEAQMEKQKMEVNHQ